jgi:hypothetical protein
VCDEGVALKSLLHEVTPAGVVGGVEDNVHQLADIEDRGCLKVKADDNRVFVGRRGGKAICEAEAEEDEEEYDRRCQAAVAVCSRAAALVSSSSRRSRVA